MNGRSFTFDELAPNTDEWWFPTDSAVLSGALVIDPDAEHAVDVELTLYIPYIIIGADEVLHIEEHDSKRMHARKAVAV
jgi:hypothetical protein